VLSREIVNKDTKVHLMKKNENT